LAVGLRYGWPPLRTSTAIPFGVRLDRADREPSAWGAPLIPTAESGDTIPQQLSPRQPAGRLGITSWTLPMGARNTDSRLDHPGTIGRGGLFSTPSPVPSARLDYSSGTATSIALPTSSRSTPAKRARWPGPKSAELKRPRPWRDSGRRTRPHPGEGVGVESPGAHRLLLDPDPLPNQQIDQLRIVNKPDRCL
jgi:hypothetical protein